jgi:predicted alpha/beta superfamily hydrolase
MKPRSWISPSWISPSGISITLLSIAAVFATSANAQSSSAGSPVSIGRRFEMSSAALSAPVSYLVHTPKFYERTDRSYPVVVLLDGNEHFAHVSASIDLLAEEGRIPEVILVGVTTVDRYANFTPPKPQSAARGPDEPARNADTYLRFISDELIPEIERTFRTRHYRVLIGHSSGGTFVVYSLLERPDVFNGYVAISPAIDRDAETLLDALPSFLDDHKTLRADMFVATANEGGRNIANTWRLSGVLALKTPFAVPGLRWRFESYPEESHGTVSLRGMEQGLRSIFDGWYLDDAAAATLIELGGVAALEKHYAEVSERMGYSIPVPRTTFSSSVHALRVRNRIDEAKLLLERAIAAYPDEPEFYFVMGQETIAGDRARAIEYFAKSLQASPTAYRDSIVIAYKVDANELLPEVAPSAQALKAYAGTYRTTDDSRTIRSKAGALAMSASTGDCELRFLSEQRFYCGGEQGDFETESNGRVRLTLQGEGYRYSLTRSK